MRLSINNFAKIKKADILVDGITVIAGENNTGKSTIGKILFSMFNSMNGIEEKIIRERKVEIESACRGILGNFIMTSTNQSAFVSIIRYARKIAEKVMEVTCNDKINKEIIEKIIKETLQQSMVANINAINEWEEMLNLMVEKITAILNFPDEIIQQEIVTRFFQSVFNYQINSLSNKNIAAELNLNVKKKNSRIVFKYNGCIEMTNEIAVMNKAVYIDNPFIMNKLNFDDALNHMDDFLRSLLTEQVNNNVMDGIIGSVLTKAKLEGVYKVLQSVVNGEIVETQDDEYYLKEDGYEEPVSFQNLSTGLKSFVLLKMLLEKGALKEKDVLILDEPEIHLHPQWQVVYAELIVLLQKQFDLSIIVATHSPYFLDAINLYSIKHGIDKKVNYYLSSMKENCVEMELVTGQIDKIYQKMATPIQALDTLRYELNNS